MAKTPPPPRTRDVARVRSQPPSRKGQTTTESFSLYPGDRELLLKLMDKWGCSKSEAFRTIVRMAAAQTGIE